MAVAIAVDMKRKERYRFKNTGGNSYQNKTLSSSALRAALLWALSCPYLGLPGALRKRFQIPVGGRQTLARHRSRPHTHIAHA